ncbi:hypothetical protein SDC9_140317 [bioreactor metagenome]|uniref:Uncharacterized protein n=1 Tax=bioreactor metagenome TaxID=1076179 RepID=A0A645DV25_9ZZZZ
MRSFAPLIISRVFINYPKGGRNEKGKCICPDPGSDSGIGKSLRTGNQRRGRCKRENEGRNGAQDAQQ